jgi:hypothetical protein
MCVTQGSRKELSTNQRSRSPSREQQSPRQRDRSSRKDKVRKKKRKTEKKLEASSSGDSSTSDDSSSPRTTTKKTHKRYRARSGFRFENLMHKLEAQRVLHAAELRENMAREVQRAVLKAKYKYKS